MRKWVRILGSVLLLGAIAWRLDWARFAAALEQVRLSYFLAACVLYVAFQIVSSLRWRLLAQVQGFTGSPLRFVAYYFIGMFFNLALPTSVGGDVVRVWYLANQAGAGPTSGRRLAALVSVLAERVNGVAVLVAAAGVLLRKPAVAPVVGAASQDVVRPASAVAASSLPVVATSAAGHQAQLMQVLKEELFGLETDRLQGRVSEGDYAESKAAIELILKRALQRGV